MKWFRKHEFDTITEYPFKKCIHCGETSGLAAWQMASMPNYMAKCDVGKPAGIFEIILGEYDCFIRHPKIR